MTSCVNKSRCGCKALLDARPRTGLLPHAKRQVDCCPGKKPTGRCALRVLLLARSGPLGGKPDYAANWLRTRKAALGDRTPMQVLATESGALAVEELLVGIEHGMFA